MPSAQRTENQTGGKLFAACARVLSPQKVKGFCMADMAVFIPDTVNTVRWESIGNGRCLFLRYREKPGLLGKWRTRKHLRNAKGCATFDKAFSEKLSLSLLSGDAARLVYALSPRLVPKAAAEEGLVLSVGREYDTAAIIEIARKVRALELVCPEGERLCEKIEEETGLSVPLYPAYHSTGEKPCLRLPGGVPLGRGAIDVSCPSESCLFTPPAALRAVCAHVGTDGDALEALLRFFGFSYGDADIFLSKSTKLCRK